MRPSGSNGIAHLQNERLLVEIYSDCVDLRSPNRRPNAGSSDESAEQDVETPGLHVGLKVVGADQVVSLTSRQEDGDRIAEGIDQGMDLGAQPAARAADRLVLSGFFWAPALCWWARTIVLSIIAYSLSASAARC